MAKYDISHPEIPQLKGFLELPDGLEPTEQHFWEAAKSVVRPYGLSQLSDEAKISAYKNGFFDGGGYNILDQEDDPSTPENEEQPGMLSMLGDAVTDLARKASPIASPYAKVMMIPEEPVAYQGNKLESQIREAGKIVFGLLDNNEAPRDIKNPLTRAMKQTGLPFENKVVQGMVKAAAMDYASDNAAVSLTGGVARAFQTAPFIAGGVSKFFNEQMLDEEDDGDILDFVNSSIAFDKVNYEYENAYDLAAFALENPVHTLAGMAGIEMEGANYDSQLQQDIRSGFQEPSPGLSIYGEVLGDPLNLAGGTLAKGLTFPQRAALSGKIKKTLIETQKLTAQATKLQKMSSKLPAESLVQQTLAKKMAEVAPKLAENQKILNKYGNSSFTSRLMGKSSPDALGKVARETFDQSTPGGKAAMAMAMDATSPAAKGGLLRTAAKAAGSLTPEILGATAGGALLGVPGAIAGAALPTMVKGLRILSSMPENTAIRYIITGGRKAGQEITENEARQRYKNFKYAVTGTLGITSGIGYSFDQDAIGDKALIGAIATLFGPKVLKQADAVARDARVIGTELIYGRTKEPFFRRVALLPTVDEGLEGALRDRFNILMKEGPSNVIGRAVDAVVQGGKAAYKEAVPTQAPFRTGQQGQQVGRNPFISAATKKTADILDSTGVGRYAETLGRFGTAMAGASALPASIGFLASGGEPEGAVTGAIISAPFTSLGAGYGMYQNYKTKADLYQKMLGDQEYYRDHLTKSERAEFDRLPGSTRMMIAGYSMSHPDVVFTPSPKGAGSFNPVTMDITYNPNVPGSILRGALAHEVTHFIEMHGLMPTVNRILFGEALTGQSGLYASYGKNGEITYTPEFIELRDIYMNQLREDPTVNADAVQRYEMDPQLIGREIFADHGVDFLLSGKRDKALNQGPVGKLLSATMNAITGSSFIRDFALKLNQPLDANGKFITTSDLFKGKLKKIPELEKLLTEYYKDVRGKSKQRIEGTEFKDPMTRRTIEKPGSRPIDDEFDVVYTVEDQKNPIVQEMLNTGGIYSTDKNGKINTDSNGAPMGMTKKEREKIERAAGDHAIKVFERNGIVVEEGPDGSKFISDIRNLPENVIDELAAGPWHPKQIATLREVSRALREGDGERAGMLLGIFAASQFRKPRAVPFKVRSTLPYGFELTKQGNILVRLHDRDQLMTNLNFLKGHTDLPKDLVGMYDALFKTDDAVWKAFHDYRNNMEAGIDGKTGLDPDPVVAEKKLNFLNALHGAIDKAQVARNPVLSSIGYGLASSNRKNSPFGAATKTFRLDRIFTASRSGRGSGFNLERAKALMTPQDATLFIPTKEADVSSIVEAVKVNPNGFTMDLMARFPKGGFAVAPDKATEFVINQNKFDSDSLKDYLETHAKLFEREGAHLGGWLKDSTGEYMLDVVFPLSYEDAVRHAMWGDQDSIFDLSTFTEIKTRNEATKQLQPPEGFSESFDEILRQKPRDIGEAAERSFRESSPIRDESIEAIRRRAEGSQGEVRKPPPPKTGGEEVDGDLLLPTAFHGSPFSFDPEPGAPLGRFQSAKIGTGKGYQAFGHGLYFSSKQKVAEHYAKAEGGSLYKVEIAPKDSEFLLWDEYIKNQPKGVRKKLQKVIDRYEMKGLEDRTLGEFYELLGVRLEIKDDLGFGSGYPAASAVLKEVGIPGIRYKDRRSFIKDDSDVFNYVVFDEADVQITGRLMPAEDMFMPLSKDELPEPFTRTEGPMGMDILYNDGVIMVGPQSQGEAPARVGFDGRVDRGRFVIYDRNEYDLAVTENRNPNPAGYVVATTTQDGKFDALIDIKLDKNVRSKGLGTKVVHSMLHDGLNGEIHVKDIMSSAKKFWKKIGVEDFKPFKDSGYKTRTEGVMRLKRGPIKLRGFRDKDTYLPMDEQTHQQFQISTRNPTAGNRIDDPVASNLVIGLDDILQTPGVAENYAKAINRYPGFKATRAKPEKVISRFVDMVMDNLLHLYDSVDPQIRERSKLWYVGARKIALEYAEKYGFSPQGVAAAMAATSPQTDWYKNVDRTRRILDTVKNEQDTIFSEEMAAQTIKNASKTDKPTISAIANSIIGKPFKELNQIQQAYFIRSFDELKRDRTYQIISPEGEFIGPARKDDGEIDQYSWLSYNQITKALSALSDDSKANISNTMGEAHKIRNFYNNILLPFLDTDAVTIDTHAVAAGLLRPLASKDLEVYNMLGSKPKGKSFASIKNSTVAGVKGLYGIYAEAYRRAAKARGVLPREMQSITWEAIRGLYPKEIKQPKFKQQINDLFKSYENGKITIDELRSKVFQKAGGIDPPSWYEGSDSVGGDRPPSSGNSQASQSSSNKGELLLPFVRRLGASNRSGGVRNTTGSPSTNRVNQFMMPAAARAAVAQGETLERFRN